MSSGYFPVDFKDLGANIKARQLGEGKEVIDGMQVFTSSRCIRRNFAYALERDGHKVVYATDSEVDAHFKSGSCLSI